MILACILLTSCSSRKENEEEAVVRVAAHSEEYKNAFVELYAQVYPETEIIVDVVSEDSSVFTVSVNGSTITITGVAAGEADLTITTDNGKTDSATVTVTAS